MLVIIHEFGHFIVAKKLGVRVDEFGFGMPPRIFGKKVGETIYSINLLPFGGFVQLLGVDENEGPVAEAKKNPRNFLSKKPFQKLAILLGGVIMNLLLAFVLYAVFFSISGYKSSLIPLISDYRFKYGEVSKLSNLIVDVQDNSPAAQEDLVPGEAIIEIDQIPVYNIGDIQAALRNKAGQAVTLLITDARSSEYNVRKVEITPSSNQAGEGIIGVYIGEAVNIDYSRGSSKYLAGPMHSYNMLAYSANVIGTLFQSSLAYKSLEPVSSGFSGPVGIYSVVKGIIAYASQLENPAQRVQVLTLALIDLTALLSLSLALLNAMPFPALDGGRVVFVIFEAITKKQISQAAEMRIHKFGIIFLMGLLALVTVKDLLNIF